MKPWVEKVSQIPVILTLPSQWKHANTKLPITKQIMVEYIGRYMRAESCRIIRKHEQLQSVRKYDFPLFGRHSKSAKRDGKEGNIGEYSQ